MDDKEPNQGTGDVDNWDGPSAKDIFGREPFVDTIVKTIQSSDEGFNLGISARWGEGKSSILEQLKPKLEALNYKVLTFAPWKYTQDEISIKRKFIIDIYAQLGKEYDETELYSSTERQANPDSEEYVEFFAKKMGVFFKFAFFTGIGFLALLLFFQWFTAIDINVTQVFLTNLFVPVLAGIAPFISKLAEITVKQTTPKIESAEQFERRFNDVITEITSGENPPGKIIIFVDDLDRCNHTEVEQILTALFTFFNNKKCTYVITADHTVIRRYISDFLKLEDELGEDGTTDFKKTNAQRHKEATEYLKKIFQINFILPKIPSDLLETWVRKLLDANLIIEFKNPYAKDYVVNLVLNNFQGNPRKIKHFIRTLAFQLEAITEKIARLPDKDNEEGKNLSKVKRSPELLAKILILQDRFPDFYDQITSEPKLLQRREEGEMDEDKDLQTLLAQEPKFFNSVTREDVYKTIDPYYFLYFSGSTGYVETKAVDPAEIRALARSADFDGLTKIINGLTDEPRNAQVEVVKKEYEAADIQPPEQVNVVRSLIHVISLIEEPTLRAQKLKDVFDARKKYASGMTALQSIDFDKFISFAGVEITNVLVTEAPFSSFALQNQILGAFVKKQSELGKGEVTDKYLQVIADGVKRYDANSSAYLAFARQLTPENFTGSDAVQSVLVDASKNAPEPFKYECFETLLEQKAQLSSVRGQEFEDEIKRQIQDEPVARALAVMAYIPSNINKSKFSMDAIAEASRFRLEKTPANELEQWVNILVHPAIQAEFGSRATEDISETIINLIDDSDAGKRSFVRGKLPDFISLASNKQKLLERLITSIAKGPIEESTPTLSTLQGMKDYWDANPDIKKNLANSLKNKPAPKEIKDLMVNFANELVPPPIRKKKADVKEKS